MEPLLWKPFTLLEMPKNYEELFSRFGGRECLRCSTVPKIPLICLICADLICLDDDCCNANDRVEMKNV